MDYNFLRSSAYTFSLQRLPQTTFGMVSASLPGISVPPADAGYPGATQWHPGTFTQFDDFTMRFMVNEDLSNYEELYRWMLQQRFNIGSKFVSEGIADSRLVSDGVLTTLTNNSNHCRQIAFRDMFPIALSPLDFDNANEASNVYCTATFKYSSFELRSLVP